MTITVTAPDGSRVNFPDGTSGETINQVMSQRWGGATADPAPTEASRDIPSIQQNVVRRPEPEGFFQGVRQWFTGEGARQPGVREFSFTDIPDRDVSTGASAFLPNVARRFGAGDSVQDAMRRFGTTADATFGAPRAALEAGFFLDANELSRANMIREQIPTAEFRRDEYGALQVRTLPDQPWRYIYAPSGLSQNRAESMITEGARHLPDALLAMLPQGLLARMGLGAVGSMANTYASQEAAQPMGGAGANTGDVIMSGVGGGAGQLASDVVAMAAPAVEAAAAQALRRIQAALPARTSVRAQPVSTQTATVPLDPIVTRVRDTVGQMADAAEQSAAASVARETTPETARAQRFYELADEFGMPDRSVRQGQATSNIDQISEEQRALRGGSGQRAYEILRESEDNILRGLHTAGRDVPVREEPRVAEDLSEAGNALRAGMLARRAQAEAAKDAQYDAAEPLLRQVQIAADAPRELAEGITARLRDAGVVAPQGQQAPNSNVYPVTAQAVNIIRGRVPAIASESPPSDGVVRLYHGVTPEAAERIRTQGFLPEGAELRASRQAARDQGPIILSVEANPRTVGVTRGPNGEWLDVESANAYRDSDMGFDDYVASGAPLGARESIPLDANAARAALTDARAAGTLFDWEAVRKGLNAIRGNARGLDKNAFIALMREFDDWYERQAFQSAEALSAIQGARAAQRRIIERFEQLDPNDIGGAQLERAYDLQLSGNDVIDGLLGTRPGSVASALSAVKRIKGAVLETPEARADFAEGRSIPAELEALREATFFRIMRPIDDMFDPQVTGELRTHASIPAESLDRNFRQALDGDGAEVLAELFTPKEIARIRRLQEFIQMLKNPPGSVNFSGSAYEGARMMRGAVTRLAEGLFGSAGAIIALPFQVLENTYTRIFRAAVANRALSRNFPRERRGIARPRAVAAGATIANTQDGDNAERASPATTP